MAPKTASQAHSTLYINFTLTLLTCAAFMYVTFELFLVGLISEISADLHVSESKIGFLVSGYAIVAGIVTIPSIWLVRRLSRKTALLISLVTLIIAEVITSCAHTYHLLALSRIIGALTHGILWSLIAPVAASLVSREKCGAATATVQSGSTIAVILGGPITTALGSYLGWRETALLLAILTTIITAGIFWVLPHDTPATHCSKNSTNNAPAKTREGSAAHLQTPNSAHSDEHPISWKTVNIICCATIIFVLANFISFTYFEVLVHYVTAQPKAVTFYMFLFGIMGAAATVFIGRNNDKHPQYSTLISVTVFAFGIALIPLSFPFHHTKLSYLILALAISIWGWGYAGIGPCYQSTIMRAAPDRQELCSSLYVTSFQIGIASGAALGGVILHHHIIWVPISSALIAGLAVAATLLWRNIFLLPAKKRSHH